MNKKFDKTIVMGLIILFFGASATLNLNAIENKDMNNPVSMPPNWYETFDVYEDGQVIDGTPDDGGWEAWDQDPTFAGFITSDVYLTPPHSLYVAEVTDVIQQFEGYNSGVWNFSAWVFIPDDFEGQAFFIILDTYYHGGGQEGNHWAAQISMDSFSETVIAQWDNWELPLVFGEWAHFLAIIDLDTDYYEMYYEDELLEYKEWTAGPGNDYAGILEIQCLDCFSAGGTGFYYDDLAFRAYGSPPEPDLSAAGEINFINVTAGSTNTGIITLTNAGSAGSTLNWDIE